MFPEIWSQKSNSPLGNPLLLGDYPVWTVYAQKISAIKLSDFWPFGISVRTFFAGQEIGQVYTSALIIPYLMAQVMSASMAIKLCVVMTVVVFYLSIYRLCSRFSMRSIASISAFVAVLGVMNSEDFKSGMWYNFLSISFSVYFIYWLDSYLYHSTKLNFLRAIFFWILALYTHPIGNIACGIYWLTSLIVDRRKIALHCVILVIVILLGGPQIWAAIHGGTSGG
jgi:hypothetical protein